jgi:hypothetical protein
MKYFKKTVSTYRYKGFTLKQGLCEHDDENYDCYELISPTKNLLALANKIFGNMYRGIELIANGTYAVLNFLPVDEDKYLELADDANDQVLQRARRAR